MMRLSLGAASDLRAEQLLRRTIGLAAYLNLMAGKDLVVPAYGVAKKRGIKSIHISRFGQVGLKFRTGKEAGVCIGPILPLPLDDIVLALWLLAKYDQDRLIRTGNWERSLAPGGVVASIASKFVPVLVLSIMFGGVFLTTYALVALLLHER